MRCLFSDGIRKNREPRMRAVERFVRVNLELCQLIEEIQEWEKSDEGRGRDR